MPYPNEHAARISDPKQYDSFARVNKTQKGFEHLPEGISFVLGIKDGKSDVQSVRFDKEKWTEETAKKWLAEHKSFGDAKFEPAAKTKNAVKSETADYVEIEGLGVIFDKPHSLKRDGVGEYFTAETDLELEKVPVKDLYVEHALLAVDFPVGEISQHEITPGVGIKFGGKLFRGERLRQSAEHYADVMGYGRTWAENQLAVAKAGVESLLSSIKSGAVGFSVGAVEHLTRKVRGWIKKFPVYEVSITRDPCEPRLLGEVAIKSLAALQPDLVSSLWAEDGDLAYELEDQSNSYDGGITVKQGPDGGLWQKVRSIWRRYVPHEAVKTQSMENTEMDEATIRGIIETTIADKLKVHAIKAGPEGDLATIMQQCLAACQACLAACEKCVAACEKCAASCEKCTAACEACTAACNAMTAGKSAAATGEIPALKSDLAALMAKLAKLEGQSANTQQGAVGDGQRAMSPMVSLAGIIGGKRG